MTSNSTLASRLARPAARRPVGAGDMVSRGLLAGGQTRLRLVQPALPSVDLVAWLAQHRDEVDAALLEHGGIVFRGFDAEAPDLFARFAQAAIPGIQPYMEGATPRTRLGDGVYTSTEFPSDQTIAQHNELSYVRHWPMKICFGCRVAPAEGGETPLTDVRQVLANLDAGIVRRFAERRWMLVRNYGTGLGPGWRQAFNTDDIDAVKRYCEGADIELEVFDAERVRTRQVRPAIRQHPATGEAVWFNHVAFWHPSSLHESVRHGLLAQFAFDELPYATCWGDGERIDDEVVEQIRQAYRQATLTAPWQRGDIVLLDNMLVAHGRNPYQGPRSIVVAMGQPHDGR